MNISEVRKRLGMTQEQVGKALGVTQATVSYWESNKIIPNAKQMLELSQLFGCKVGELYGEA